MTMRRIIVLLLFAAMFRTATAISWHAVNIDYETVAAMQAGYTAEYLMEGSTATALDEILSHYKSAGIASTGILLSKRNDWNAMRNPGLFATEENYYYTRILSLVKDRIMPKFITVAAKMVKQPENAMYWGPYLYKTTTNVENLCKEFELVVTNGRLSFRDVQFLLVNEKLRKLFDLAELGSVNWKELLDKLGEFGKGLTKEDMKEDFKTLGAVLSQAGQHAASGNLQKITRIGNVFHSSPSEIINLLDDFRIYYNENIKDGINVKQLLMQVILTDDVDGVARLFQIDDYNITGYISNYIKELQGQYYTQRWYVYAEDKGNNVLYEYTPTAYGDRNDSRWNTAWSHYISPKDNCYHHTLTSSEITSLKSKIESLTGWSQSKVDNYNKNNPGHSATITYTLKHEDRDESYKHGWGSTHHKLHCFYSYAIKVVDSWSNEEDVYEEIFDSQTMDKGTFMAKMQSIVDNYNKDNKDSGNGIVYKLGSDNPRYYTMADEKKMAGCNSVSFLASCDDGANLAEGSFNWKENGKQGNSLEDPKSKNFAMSSTQAVQGGDKELLQYQKQYEDEIASLSYEISSNDAKMQSLVDRIYQAKLAEDQALASKLQREYDTLSATNANLKYQLSEVQDELNQTNAALNEYYNDLSDDLDGPYRIPANMNELAGMYQLQWQDAGEWVNGSGSYVFVRHAYCPQIKSVVTYTATLKVARKPKYFLGIRIHRAILSVDFRLSSSSSSENVIEVMQLDMGKSEKERADEVNKRLHELMADMPDCTISVKYEYANNADLSDDGDEDGIHLLWASDRLDIARDVEYQLTSIYAQLVLLEKVMTARQSLWDFLKNQMLEVASRQGRGTIAEYALQRWEDASLAAMKESNSQKDENKTNND